MGYTNIRQINRIIGPFWKAVIRGSDPAVI